MTDELKHISAGIADELEGAEDYLLDAIKHKEYYPKLAEKYAEMSRQELHHAEELYDIGCSMIGSVTDEAEKSRLVDMWKWAWDMLSEKIVRIKAIEDMYKG